ncbi:unknown protein [Paenibacillus amylolyticus]|uniref:Uncharacterized protein n=1 Tax=Paenibacillus amylolyticus TaxID=1451 RepID=A0A100VSJ3_PAEAM|nr:unknown protein [Paenibacillus amylolyticus]
MAQASGKLRVRRHNGRAESELVHTKEAVWRLRAQIGSNHGVGYHEGADVCPAGEPAADAGTDHQHVGW